MIWNFFKPLFLYNDYFDSTPIFTKNTSNLCEFFLHDAQNQKRSPEFSLRKVYETMGKWFFISRGIHRTVDIRICDLKLTFYFHLKCNHFLEHLTHIITFTLQIQQSKSYLGIKTNYHLSQYNHSLFSSSNFQIIFDSYVG